MTIGAIGAIAAVICLLIGFAIAIFEGKLLFDSSTWFLAAIPCALLGGPVVFRKGGSS